MYFYKTNTIGILLLLFCQDVASQRRITHPNKTRGEKRYMVYLTKAELANKTYDNWICGGAIVSSLFILTSAACVEDVKYMYAIAGYDKYVAQGILDIEGDACIKKSRKKIVFTCVPKAYDFAYDKYEKWSYIDIAAVKVESPYDFTVPISTYCSWIPDKIEISYDPKHMRPGTSAMVLGWGHATKWRAKNDTKDYNSNLLQYASVEIKSREECKKKYEKLPVLHKVIDSYMICTHGSGNIDDQGHEIKKAQPIQEGCVNSDYGDCTKAINSERRRRNFEANDNKQNKSDDGKFTSYGFHFEDVPTGVETDPSTRRNDNDNPFYHMPTRRHGICQNDHGGPLVTWVGAKETLIGIASVFLVKDENCVGPYLYTSTQCNGAFISCVIDASSTDEIENIKQEDYSERRFLPQGFKYSMCNLPIEKKGFEIIERRISWGEHPDGPAQDELPYDVFERPQAPLSSMYG